MMPWVSIPNPAGGPPIVAHVKMARRPRKRCCACGELGATRECDWKVPGKKSGTCDAMICERCAYSPAPEKDLCPEHAKAWAEHPANTKDAQR